MIRIRLHCGKCRHRHVVLQNELLPESHRCGSCGELLLEIEPIKGAVYVLSNSAMPGLLKIGYTTRPVSERVDEISNATGVPEAFVCKAHWLSYRPDIDERKIHQLFADERSNGNREFFRIGVEDAVKRIAACMKGPPEGSADPHVSPIQAPGLSAAATEKLRRTPYNKSPGYDSPHPSERSDTNLGGFGSDRYR